MEKNNITYRFINSVPDSETLKSLLALYKTIFEEADLSFFKNRIQSEVNVFSVLTYSETELIGFKIGYSQNDTIFYSWIGGVIAKFRNQGIGKQLAMHQENYAREKGYKTLKTKSMNQFKSMMILNLKNGFDISKIYTNEKGQTKIVFEKTLN